MHKEGKYLKTKWGWEKKLGEIAIVGHFIRNYIRKRINREELLVCETIGLFFFFLQNTGPEGLLS